MEMLKRRWDDQITNVVNGIGGTDGENGGTDGEKGRWIRQNTSI